MSSLSQLRNQHVHSVLAGIVIEKAFEAGFWPSIFVFKEKNEGYVGLSWTDNNAKCTSNDSGCIASALMMHIPQELIAKAVFIDNSLLELHPEKPANFKVVYNLKELFPKNAANNLFCLEEASE